MSFFIRMSRAQADLSHISHFFPHWLMVLLNSPPAFPCCYLPLDPQDQCNLHCMYVFVSVNVSFLEI